MGLGFELRASYSQSRCFTTWATCPVHFTLVILEMRAHELFVWAGLEPWSTQFQPPKKLGLQVWATGTQFNPPLYLKSYY
jgi:hypothetical protein